MTEQPEAYQAAVLSELEHLIEQRHKDLSILKQANAVLYEQMLGETAQLLHATPQLVQDVLMQTCIERGDKPMQVLDTLHDFLVMRAAWQQHEHAPEEEESPFMGRNE